MVTVGSPHLTAAGAAWDDGPAAGEWMRGPLGPFGPSVGHAVPLGYEAYAIVPIPHEDEPLRVLGALLDVLGPFTGEQRVHSGIWDGFGFLYATGSDPRTAPGMGVGVTWEGPDRPSQEEIDRALAEAREQMAKERVERPDADPLPLPNRKYHLWTGPLRSPLAFHHEPHSPPSLVWPEDRSWFVGVPIYTFDIAVAGDAEVIDAVLADLRLRARRATTDEWLEGDD